MCTEIHWCTVWRRFKKKTGLDVRVFDDALTFKIAMMVADHMKYMKDNQVSRCLDSDI